MCSRFFVRSPKNSAGILSYVKGFLGKMTEKMQTDDVLSRQAVFVRCCLIFLGLYKWATAYCLTGRVVSRLPYIKFHRQLQVLPAGLRLSCSLALSRSWRISQAAGTAHHHTIRNNVLGVSVFSFQDAETKRLVHITPNQTQ